MRSTRLPARSTPCSTGSSSSPSACAPCSTARPTICARRSNRLQATAEGAMGQVIAGSPERRVLERVTTEVDHMRATLDALLRIALAETGTVAREPVDLSELVASMVELYAPVSEERGIALESAVASGAQVQGSRQLLAQALANLLDNAIKFTPDGGHIRVLLRKAPVGGAGGHRRGRRSGHSGGQARDRARPARAPGRGAQRARVRARALARGGGHQAARRAPDSGRCGARACACRCASSRFQRQFPVAIRITGGGGRPRPHEAATRLIRKALKNKGA